MSKPIDSLHELAQTDVGCYVQLEGFGILSGLTGKPGKHSLHKIVALETNTIRVRSYRGTTDLDIPERNWDQKAIVHTRTEFRALGEWGE
jgi:hypothetical protein